jgi:L-asparaginase
LQPKLIIHGGAGRRIRDQSRRTSVRADLREIAGEIYGLLDKGVSAVDAVELGCRRLEDNPNFNAGTGSVLQSDGQIRLTAAIMNGEAQSLSGVINAAMIRNPITLARHLQDAPDRVLAAIGAERMARELELPVYDPRIERRIEEWARERRSDQRSDMADVVAESADNRRTGTVGVVALDRNGFLCCGTSTGGRGFERPGRVSDSAMPAGTYATRLAAVSCTGIGEDIIDEALAVRIVVRREDGHSLHAAMRRSLVESKTRHRSLGAIALDADGEISWGKTCEILLAAFHDGQRIEDTLDMPNSACMGTLNEAGMREFVLDKEETEE